MNNPLMTIEELRKFEGCEHLSDEEAENVINTLQDYASLVYEHAVDEERKEREKEKEKGQIED
jgi:hypothetical protein